ncbi:hypothetical protein IW261DRAFT_1564440 [Armillaria novae-zelandiae]|uniref:Uncharacterized protein n=1 Tax=Armillaria novae-zelandiae TaxID=153914 RepID=A0AA39P9K5_9AGAR|nr:hypothetical protein IW261DRAFT_1564440 [Armillaria novae-zelandiae]
MATRTDIPAWLTDSDMAYLTDLFDESLNSRIVFSLLLGLYTGIISVTISNISINKSRRSGQVMIVVIILLYIMTIANGAMNWSFLFSYILHGRNIWIRYLSVRMSKDIMKSVGLGVTGIICSILADFAMIWRCWMVWGQRYLIVVFPTLCLVACVVFKIMDIRLVFMDGIAPDIHNLLAYALLALATTLWCTLAIIYRILIVGRVNGGPRDRLRTYHHVIEVLVESSAFYCVCLIIYTICYASGSWGENYIDVITAITRGIAPTLLIGRIAAGHARPDDSWHGSIVSSLHFGQDRSQTSTQDSMFSFNPDDDPEAQVEQTDELNSEYIHQTSSEKVRVSSSDVEAEQEEVEIGHNAFTVVPGQ